MMIDSKNRLIICKSNTYLIKIYKDLVQIHIKDHVHPDEPHQILYKNNNEL